ncbi:chordin-like protein 1 [Panulirus ornatus]|uniref:chordin-like protein 1 n=1 Tax=Panulirus ornatus TaxID=150431 RepID=UPI003A854C8C
MEVAVKVSLVTWVIFAGLYQVEGGCRMGSNEYEVGEVWHPRLQNAVSNYCVTCRCVMNEHNVYKYDCTSERCPEGCSGGPDEGECCSICSDTSSGGEASSGSGEASPSSSSGGGGSSTRGGSPAGTTAAGEQVMVGRSSRVCVVAGMMYNHGDTFSSNYSHANVDKCEHCYCSDGVAQCRTKSCPPVSCSSPIYTRHDCCRMCPDDSTELDWDTMVSFSDPSAAKGSADHDCKIGGRYFINGSIWHPVIGPFGEMDCVLCKCYNRRIDCSRLKCQSRDKLQCNKPIKVAGQCCPVCPLRVVTNTTPQVSGNTVRCLTVRSRLAVWKNNGAGNNSAVVHYVFEPLEGSTGILHLHRMMLQNRNLENLHIYDISREEFRNLSSTYTFSLLGSSTTKSMKKFKKKEQKKAQRCKKNGRCSLQLEDLEKHLKIKPPEERTHCNRGEKNM